MKKRDALAIALRIVGIYCVAQALMLLTQLPIALRFVFAERMPPGLNRPWYVGLSIAPPILTLGLACVLLRWAGCIAGKLVREDDEISVPAATGWERPVFVLSLRIVGVVCLVRGLPALVRTLAQFTLTGQYRVGMTSYVRAEIIADLVILGLGAYFISGGKHLVHFVFRQRDTGTA